MKKTLMVFACTALLAASLSACGSKPAENKDTGTASSAAASSSSSEQQQENGGVQSCAPPKSLSRTYSAESFGGKKSVKGNRQGVLSRSITRRSGRIAK